MKKSLRIVFILFISLAFALPVFASAEIAAGIKPDSIFYSLDLLGEKISLFFTRDPYEKAKKSILFADERIAEIKASTDNQKAALKAGDEFTKDISQSFESFDNIKDDSKKVGFLVSFENRYKEHWGTLISLYESLPQEEQPIFRENLVAYESKLQRGLDEIQGVMDKKSETSATTTSVSKSINIEKPKKETLEPKTVSSSATSPVKTNTDTNEQIAVKMATDTEYPNSALDISVKQEIKSNWNSIMKYYTGERGKNTVENMYNDILDAYKKWKNWQQFELEDAKCRADLNEEIKLGLARQKEYFNGGGDSSMDSIVQSLNRASGAVRPESCIRADGLSSLLGFDRSSSYSPSTYQQITPAPITSGPSAYDEFQAYLEKQKQNTFQRDTCERLGGAYIGTPTSGTCSY